MEDILIGLILSFCSGNGGCRTSMIEHDYILIEKLGKHHNTAEKCIYYKKGTKEYFINTNIDNWGKCLTKDNQ